MDAIVSVIITTYCRPVQMLMRALNSARNQTYQNLEIIIVDDSPEDYSERKDVSQFVLSLNDNRIKYIAHEKNSGACVARNTGLAAANGKYIAFLDDDDEWLEDKISEQVSVIEECDDQTALVYCNTCRISDSSEQWINEERELLAGYVYEKLILSNFIGSTSFPLIKTEVLRQIGGFDPLMKSAQDYDVWLRISQKYKVAYTEKVLAVYHTHQGECITVNPKNKISGLERLHEKNIDYIKTNANAYWYRTIKIAPFYAADNQMGKAIGCWFQAVMKKPFRFKGNLKYLYFILFNGIQSRKNCSTKKQEEKDGK